MPGPITSFFKETPSPRSFLSNDRILLFTLSFLSLYVELLLIRHVGSEFRIFSHFKNLALIAAFLGLGAGYLAKRRVGMMISAVAIACVPLVAHPQSGFLNISNYLNLDDFNMWEVGNINVDFGQLALGLFMLVVLFFMIFAAMIPFGQALAEIFNRSTHRIIDYSINIIGALLGIWFFAWLSFERFTPIVWYSLVFLAYIALFRWSPAKIGALLLMATLSVVAIVAAKNPVVIEEIWSPYQKIDIKQILVFSRNNLKKEPYTFYRLQTNHTYYMFMLDWSYEARKKYPELFPPEYDAYQYYDLPYTMMGQVDDVLILGAGGGNDVAAALRHGAKSVTAVEIDPVIIEMGKKYNMERPYASDKVTIINNDARNFLRETDEKYDLIIVGLLDSHTLTSSFSNTNLDSFMYTLESVKDMRNHLKEDGVLALSFLVSFDWIGGKLLQMVEQVFEEEPVVIYQSYVKNGWTGGGTYYMAGKKKGLTKELVVKDKALKKLWENSNKKVEAFRAADTRPQTDDWPYLYIPTERIPKLHIFVSAILILIFFLVYKTSFGRPTASNLHFAALGAGFLLLEVSVISRFALFWGTTWVVSSIVISLILVTILIANVTFIKTRGSVPYPALYAALGAGLVAIYLIPLESAWIIVLYLIPFSVIGYLFAKSFDGAQNAGQALGYNLFGSLAGGLSESLSFLWGISALILVALVFYALSFVAIMARTRQ